MSSNHGSTVDIDDEDEDFGALLEKHLPKAAPKTQGELVDATVVRILDDVVLLNYGSKEEAAVPASEFMDAKGVLTVKPGDQVRVLLLGLDEEANPRFSYRKARQAEAAVMLAQAAKAQVPVRGVINRVVNGGVIVDVGMPAFMPASQVDVQRVQDLNSLVGQDVEVYVLEFDEHQNRAVVSRRKLQTERRDKDREAYLEKLQVGATVTAKVREVLDFGAFVDIGPVQGMVPRSELTYDRTVKTADVFVPGQEVQLKVLEISRDSGRVTLSRKRLGEDPWLNIEKNYGVGTSVTGQVISIQSFGAFVQLEEGITGLVHVKDISWVKERKSAEETFKIGDTLTCQVADIDKEHKRVALSLKHLSRDPWLDIADKYPVGSRHKGTVTQLRDFGAFVRLDESVEGLLHIGDLSWEKRYKHPNEALSEGQEIEVTILSHDLERRRIGLGQKQLTGSPFQEFISSYPVGSLVTGRVSRIVQFGAFVELAPGLEGLIHISELDENRVDSPEKVVRLNDDVTVKVLEVKPDKQKISLSRKAAIQQQEDDNIRQYTSNQQIGSIGGSALGAALQAALKKKE